MFCYAQYAVDDGSKHLECDLGWPEHGDGTLKPGIFKREFQNGDLLMHYPEPNNEK